MLNAYWNGQDIDIDRKRFEALLKNYLPEFPVLIDGAIKNAGIRKEEIDIVMLTRGHSNWYFVRDMLLGKNGSPIDLPKVKASRGSRALSVCSGGI